jgi:hypothetical protein
LIFFAVILLSIFLGGFIALRCEMTIRFDTSEYSFTSSTRKFILLACVDMITSVSSSEFGSLIVIEDFYFK